MIPGKIIGHPDTIYKVLGRAENNIERGSVFSSLEVIESHSFPRDKLWWDDRFIVFLEYFYAFNILGDLILAGSEKEALEFFRGYTSLKEETIEEYLIFSPPEKLPDEDEISVFYESEYDIPKGINESAIDSDFQGKIKVTMPAKGWGKVTEGLLVVDYF